jgi:hypothetical protein
MCMWSHIVFAIFKQLHRGRRGRDRMVV